MCNETIQVVDHSPTVLNQNTQRFITTCQCSLSHNSFLFNTDDKSDIDTIKLEPIEKVISLHTPKDTPRTSSDDTEHEKLAITIEPATQPKPIFTHKLPDNFFTSCSPPSPISPFGIFASKTTSPVSSPHMHPTLNKACPVEPIETILEKKLNTIDEEPATTKKKNDVLPTSSFSVQNQYALSKPQSTTKKTHRLSLQDFDIKQTVGTGSFARVHLAKSKVNGKYYAIKAINKKDLLSRRQVEHAHNERDILGSVSHPFLVKLWGTFQSESHVFLVMDYVPGGELFRIIRKQKKLTEDAARFYAAEVALAIEYLHSINVAYRDLKPENILIDHRGHIKLTDFGFAKRVPDMTWTVCGTPDYLAPEIIRSQGYTKAVDWWSLGVLIFEMLTGRPPFAAKTPVDQFQKILECDITWPEDMSADAKDLLQNLLKTKPTERFGNLKDGANDIKNHRWFKSLDFNQVFERKFTPPFVPHIKFAGDTHCFDYYEENLLPYDMMHTNQPYCDHFAYF